MSDNGTTGVWHRVTKRQDCPSYIQAIDIYLLMPAFEGTMLHVEKGFACKREILTLHVPALISGYFCIYNNRGYCKWIFSWAFRFLSTWTPSVEFAEYFLYVHTYSDWCKSVVKGNRVTRKTMDYKFLPFWSISRISLMCSPCCLHFFGDVAFA